MPASALGRPGRQAPGRTRQKPHIKAARLTQARYSPQPSSSPTIVQLADAASMAALRAVACDRLRRTIDPATTPEDLAPVGRTGKTRTAGRTIRLPPTADGQSPRNDYDPERWRGLSQDARRR